MPSLHAARVNRHCRSRHPVSGLVVASGYFTVGGNDPITRTGEEVCAPGTWCEGGVWTQCPAGSYGATEGLTTPTCTGKCEAGYYCPTGSTDPKQVPCGNFTVFCPAGSGERQ